MSTHYLSAGQKATALVVVQPRTCRIEFTSRHFLLLLLLGCNDAPANHFRTRHPHLTRVGSRECKLCQEAQFFLTCGFVVVDFCTGQRLSSPFLSCCFLCCRGPRRRQRPLFAGVDLRSWAAATAKRVSLALIVLHSDSSLASCTRRRRRRSPVDDKGRKKNEDSNNSERRRCRRRRRIQVSAALRSRHR